MTEAALILGCYLLGSLNFALLLSFLIKKSDIRLHDHAGASGAFRQYGVVLGTTVLLLDGLKGALAAWVCLLLFPAQSWVMVAAGFAVVAGHNWPIFFRFSGGGGLTTVDGYLLVIKPLDTLLFTVFTFLMALLFAKVPALGRAVRPLGRPLPAAAVFGLILYIIYSLIWYGFLWFTLLLLVFGVEMVIRRSHVVKVEDKARKEDDA
ncbi:MAG: glycerol-3-phosphate acyltransferase [Coprothermobacterota bacterium]|jgi:glycerol-3-phosphate acyltransferase PlsY|nr:glycerol-3-phosphate acyltransferase [Coprothermobacterota bacterium]